MCKSQNKSKECRCFQIKCKAYCLLQPATEAPLLQWGAQHWWALQQCPRVGIATLPQSVVSVCWCVVMVCLCVGRRGPATDSRLQWLLLLSTSSSVQCTAARPSTQHRAAGADIFPCSTAPPPAPPHGQHAVLSSNEGNIHTLHAHRSKYITRATFWYHQKRHTLENMHLYYIWV